MRRSAELKKQKIENEESWKWDEERSKMSTQVDEPPQRLRPDFGCHNHGLWPLDHTSPKSLQFHRIEAWFSESRAPPFVVERRAVQEKKRGS